MKYKFSFCTNGLENNARLVRFIIMIYDDDEDDDDLFDISPATNLYGEKPNNEKFWENSLLFPNDCINGKALDVIYDTNTSLWYVMDIYGRIVEGWNYSIDAGNLTIDYNKNPSTITDISWGGFCSGLEDYGNNNGGSMNAAISFDIFPINKLNYSVYNSNHYFKPDDNDHDKLTEMSEILYYHTNITRRNSDLSLAKVDYFDDWWEIRYGMDPNDPYDNETGPYTWKQNRDNDTDGLNYLVEYCYFEWGANPYVRDIFVEIDWMYKPGELWDTGAPETGYYYLNPKEYRMKEGSQNMVIRSFIGHQICLHIDDGSMGGGGSIGYNKYLAFYDTNKRASSGMNRKDGIGGNPSKPATRSVEGLWNGKYTDSSGNPIFDSNRKDIFHYCVIGYKASYIRSGGKTPHGRAAMAKYDSTTKGDFLAIWGGAMTGKRDCNEWWASMFMHELGHCFGLDADGMYKKNGNPLNPSDYPSSMRYGREKGEKGFIDYSSKTGIRTVYKSDSTNSDPKVHSHSPLNRDDWGTLDLGYFN